MNHKLLQRIATIITVLFIAILVSVSGTFGTTCIAQDVARMTLDGQLTSLSVDIEQWFGEQPPTNPTGIRSIRIDAQPGAMRFESAAVTELLLERLATRLDQRSELTIHGTLRFGEATSISNRGLHILSLVLEIEDRESRSLATFEREINETKDIAIVMGQTLAIPETTEYAIRNQALAKAIESPSCLILPDYRIAAVGLPQITMQLLESGSADTDGKKPVSISSEDGYATAKVDGDFSISLVNEFDYPVCAVLYLDGVALTEPPALAASNPESKETRLAPAAETNAQLNSIRGYWLESNAHHVILLDAKKQATQTITVASHAAHRERAQTRTQPFELTSARFIDKDGVVLDGYMVDAPESIVSIRLTKTHEQNSPKKLSHENSETTINNRRPPTLEAHE